MKVTLLEIVQDILSDMDGDEVNTIGGTTESEQVAKIVRSTYNAMASSRNWPHQLKTVVLDPYSDLALPVYMRLQEGVKELKSIRYNKRKVADTRSYYKPIDYYTTDKFLDLVNARNSDKSEVVVVSDPTGIELQIINNKHPQYYTSFDDDTLVFDSYDSSVTATLAQDDFQAMGYVQSRFEMSDTYIPDLPAEAFQLLIEEATSTAQFKLREFVDNKAEQEAVRQRQQMSRNSWRVKGGIRFPNYGRNSNKGSDGFTAQGPKAER